MQNIYGHLHNCCNPLITLIRESLILLFLPLPIIYLIWPTDHKCVQVAISVFRTETRVYFEADDWSETWAQEMQKINDYLLTTSLILLGAILLIIFKV